MTANFTSYATWTNLLDKFGDGDDSVLEELDRISFVLDAGTAIRFCARVEEAYRKRKQNWLYGLQRSFQPHNLKKDRDFEIAIRNGKQNLLPLNRFVRLAGLPANLKETLTTDLEDFVAEIKKSLKDNIGKTLQSREKLLVLVSNFNLDTTPVKTTGPNSGASAPFLGRKIIF